jgi:hypothetical protein
MNHWKLAMFRMNTVQVPTQKTKKKHTVNGATMIIVRKKITSSNSPA